MVGETEVHPTRYGCAICEQQSVYPLLDFIGLIEHEVQREEGPAETRLIKCTRNAAASIALVCAETPFHNATAIVKQLTGVDLDTMTAFRVTDSVGSEFVEQPPTEADDDRMAVIAEKLADNTLKTRFEQLKLAENLDEIIADMALDGSEGVLRKDYKGPIIRVVYIQADGTGVPGRRIELAGVKGKQPDGSAKTFEAKVGAVFVVEYTDNWQPLLKDNGELYRDKVVKYMGTVRKVDDFGPMLAQFTLENGLADADAVVFLGDGARWIRGIQEKYFPFAIVGIDLYHAIERVGLLMDHLQFKGQSSKENKEKFKLECISFLKQGKIQNMLDRIMEIPCKVKHETKLVSALDYFRSNMDRMNYGVFTALGLYVGSGVIEAACKVIVGSRMKNAGMHWSKANAEKLISLRCAIRNKVFLDAYLPNRCSSVLPAA